MARAALEAYGVASLPTDTVLGRVSRGEPGTRLPRLRLLADAFCLYQKRAHP